jgi:thioredoxin 1
MEKEVLFHVTDETFNEGVLQSDLLVLVGFWEPWCGPCLSIAPAVEESAKEYSGRIKAGKMNGVWDWGNPDSYSFQRRKGCSSGSGDCSQV